MTTEGLKTGTVGYTRNCDEFATYKKAQDADKGKKETSRLEPVVVQTAARVFGDMQTEDAVARKSSRKVQREEDCTDVLRVWPLQSEGTPKTVPLPLELKKFLEDEYQRLRPLFDNYWSELPKGRFFAWGQPVLESEMIEKWLRCFLSGLHSPLDEELNRQKEQGRLFFDVPLGRGEREAYELARFLTYEESVFLDWSGGFNKVWFVLHWKKG